MRSHTDNTYGYRSRPAPKHAESRLTICEAELRRYMAASPHLTRHQVLHVMLAARHDRARVEELLGACEAVMNSPAMAWLGHASGEGRPIDPTLEIAPETQPSLRKPRGVPLCAAQLQPILRRVETELERPLRVADMAQAVGLSLFHFSREFRRVTGTSPYAYILRRRMARSALLLAGSEMPILEIARTVGFKTHAHFSATFHKMIGMSPHAYRVRYSSTGAVNPSRGLASRLPLTSCTDAPSREKA